MSGTRRPVIRINRPVPERVAPVRAPRLRIGLLGGSFNPAHQGHLAISLEALKRLKTGPRLVAGVATESPEALG